MHRCSLPPDVHLELLLRDESLVLAKQPGVPEDGPVEPADGPSEQRCRPEVAHTSAGGTAAVPVTERAADRNRLMARGVAPGPPAPAAANHLPGVPVEAAGGAERVGPLGPRLAEDAEAEAVPVTGARITVSRGGPRSRPRALFCP